MAATSWGPARSGMGRPSSRASLISLPHPPKESRGIRKLLACRAACRSTCLLLWAVARWHGDSCAAVASSHVSLAAAETCEPWLRPQSTVSPCCRGEVSATRRMLARRLEERIVWQHRMPAWSAQPLRRLQASSHRDWQLAAFSCSRPSAPDDLGVLCAGHHVVGAIHEQAGCPQHLRPPQAGCQRPGAGVRNR